MMETYIELLIANFIAFNMFEIKEMWNIPDKKVNPVCSSLYLAFF